MTKLFLPLVLCFLFSGNLFAQSTTLNDLDNALDNVDQLNSRLSYIADQGARNGRISPAEYQELNMCETQLDAETQTIMTTCHQSGLTGLVTAAQCFCDASSQTLDGIDELQRSYETQSSTSPTGSGLSSDISTLSTAAGGIRKEVQISNAGNK